MTSLRRMMLAGVAACAVGLGLAGTASAGPTFTFKVQTANQITPANPGGQFQATDISPGFNFAGAITATFNYNGPLNFNVLHSQNATNTGDLNSTFFSPNVGSISNYAGAGSIALPGGANFATLASFLGSSGSASGYQYGSLYTIGLGTLAAGTRLTITHDDGVSVFQGSARIGTTTAGATSVITESVVLASTADTTLFFGRQNGAPSILTVTVPEPASMALFGAGLLGLAMVRRRSRKSNAAA